MTVEVCAPALEVRCLELGVVSIGGRGSAYGSRVFDSQGYRCACGCGGRAAPRGPSQSTAFVTDNRVENLSKGSPLNAISGFTTASGASHRPRRWRRLVHLTK